MIVLRKEMKELNKQYRETDRIYHEISMQSGLSDSAFMILYAIVELGDGCQQKDIADLYCYSRQTINSSKCWCVCYAICNGWNIIPSILLV